MSHEDDERSGGRDHRNARGGGRGRSPDAGGGDGGRGAVGKRTLTDGLRGPGADARSGRYRR